MKSWKSVGILILISSTLPELLTGNTPIIAFLHPATILFLVIGYGLAVLVIREIAVRTNASFGGVVLMGCAYGIFNEGLFSKTMVLMTTLPISAFTGYGRIAGINTAWALYIMLWHALSSVLFPVVLTYLLYPDQKDQPWLNETFTVILGVLLLGVGILNFLGNNIVTGAPVQLAIFLILMAVFILIGSCLKKKSAPKLLATELSPTPIYAGLSVFLFSNMLLLIIAGERLPIVFYCLTYVLGVSVYIWIIKRNHWNTVSHVSLFGLGMYMEIALTLVVVSFIRSNGLEYLSTAILSEILLIWCAKRTLGNSMIPV